MSTRTLMDQRHARHTTTTRPAPVPRRVATVSNGPGGWLKRLCAWFGYQPETKCSCADHVRQMDTQGTVWCQHNMDVIVGWLEAERTRRGLSCARIVWTAACAWWGWTIGRAYGALDRWVFTVAARGLVRLALWLAKQ